jgi:Protein of unknown function (DUF1236)
MKASTLVGDGLKLNWSESMRIRALSALTGLLLTAGVGVGLAQTTVVVSPEEETAIREYVVTQKVEPMEAPAGVEIKVGAALPDTVQLKTLEEPKVKTKYEYVVIGKQTVLVEPGTRKVVHIIED